MITTGSPNQNHYLKNHSDKRHASALFAKNNQNSASYGSEGNTFDENNSQRGFVVLSGEPARSEASAAANVEPPFRPEYGLGQAIEMQGVREEHKGIHVRNEIIVHDAV